MQLIVTYDTRTLCSSALRLGFEFRHFSPCFITRSRYFCPRSDTSAGRMDTRREGERESCTRVLRMSVHLFVFYNSRKQECEIKQELLSAGYCIPRVACLNPVIVKFASDGWMSRARNSSSKVEFNLELNLCSSFVHSVLDCRIVIVALKSLFLDLIEYIRIRWFLSSFFF